MKFDKPTILPAMGTSLAIFNDPDNKPLIAIEYQISNWRDKAEIYVARAFFDKSHLRRKMVSVELLDGKTADIPFVEACIYTMAVIIGGYEAPNKDLMTKFNGAGNIVSPVPFIVGHLAKHFFYNGGNHMLTSIPHMATVVNNALLAYTFEKNIETH